MGGTGVVVETRVDRKRVIVIPKSVAEEAKIGEGQRVRTFAAGDKIVIEPARGAVWLALYGRKIGRITPEEVEEESAREQGRLQATA